MCTHTYLLLLYFANFFQQKFAQSNYNTYLCSQIILVLTPIKELLISKLQIMKKNYFKFLMAIALMLGGVSLTSCDEMLDNPVEEPTEQTEEPKIVETETGAEITINALSDISGLLGELTPMIEAKNGEEFVLDVKSNGSLKVTETDNIILVPNVAGCNLVINFDNSLVSDGSAVTMKLDNKAATRAMVDENGTVYDKNVALNLKNTNTDLILDVPGVTVTVSTLSSIQVVNGLAIVKEGASINTYVYAPKSNDVALYNGATEYVQVNWINDETGEKEGWGSFPAVRSLKEWEYHFKNIKVVKGQADYARISLESEDYKLDKLTIAEGATVVLNQYPIVKEIVGEGNGATVKMSTWLSWRDEGSKETHTFCELYYVDKISNVNIVPLEPSDGDPFKDYTQFVSLNDVPANIEGDAIKFFTNISFRDPESASTTVKNCKFEPVQYKEIQICVPFQTEEISSFKFTFENCEFAEGAKISNYVRSEKDVKDADGNPVYQDCSIYYWVDGQDEPRYVWLVSDLPADVAAAGKLTYDEFFNGERPKGYFAQGTTTVTEPVEYNNYYVFISFTNCKYAGAALTKDTKFYNTNSKKGVNFRYEIDGVIYQLVKLYDDGGETMLIPAV